MSSILSERHKHTNAAAQVLFKKIAEELAKIESDNINLDTIDVRGKGRLAKSLIQYNDVRFAYRRKIDITKLDWELPIEPDTRILQLWYMMDHLGPQITDISNYAHHGTLEGHPTLSAVPIDLGFENDPNDPRSAAMSFNRGTDSISALEGELIVTPDHPHLNYLTNTARYPTAKFSIMFRFYSTDWSPTTIDSGIVFRRFGTKKEDANNGWLVAFDDGGHIVFHVLHDGTWYKRQSGSLLLNSYYNVVVTYDETAGATSDDRINIYWNRTLLPETIPNVVVDQSNTELGEFILPSGNEFRHFIGGRATRDGYFRGILQDYREYSPISTVPSRSVLTPAQVRNWFINRLTISNAPFGNVAVVGFFNASNNALNIPTPINPAVLNRSLYHI